MALCSGARGGLPGSGEDNGFDVLHVCYPRCRRVLGHSHFRSSLTFAEEAAGLGCDFPR